MDTAICPQKQFGFKNSNPYTTAGGGGVFVLYLDFWHVVKMVILLDFPVCHLVFSTVNLCKLGDGMCCWILFL